MVFHSLQFLVFFPIVLGLYFLALPRVRWAPLLAASYYFYMCWKAEYAFLIGLSTLGTWGAGWAIHRARAVGARRAWLLAALLLNLGILFAFKYFNFVSDSLQTALTPLGFATELPLLEVLLPIGISFYTFQALSYVLDIYRGAREPTGHLGHFALYVAFFPQLVAGPIERSTSLLPQFRQAQSFDAQRIADGLKLMAWGFFKKLVIADRLAEYVNVVYQNPSLYPGTHTLVATYFFAIQIYCDFSGYSDIAVGAAQTFGYRLSDNFRQPYLARSVADFWRRWHITLSYWFRDYLYYPMGGSRVARLRWVLNIVVVFLVSGLWHGAAWTFVAWGAFHGVCIVLERYSAGARERCYGALGLADNKGLRHVVSVVVTFHLVCIGWVFFRAASFSDVQVVFGNLWHPAMLKFGVRLPQFRSLELAIAALAIATLVIADALQRRGSLRQALSMRPAWFRFGAYYLLCCAIVLFGVFGGKEFIYFQF
jgi:alginate O-acetyltransferase complex protein AlgI